MRSHSGRVAVVLGTRPEIITLAGVIRLLGPDGYILHSGQHYDHELSASFFATYRLPEPEVLLDDVGGASRGEQFARIQTQLTALFAVDPPAAVVVQGDTNTAAAGAQAAHFARIPVIHVVAGLRSRGRNMPEEINRMLVGVVSDLLCAPTPESAANLEAEGVDPAAIHITGNTVVEATLESLPPQAEIDRLLDEHGVAPDRFVIATIHRPENTDDPERLRSILRAFADLPLATVFPVHPRTKRYVAAAGLDGLLGRLCTTPPLDHRSFLGLASRARLLVSDSGGVQEETTVLKRPLVVVRNSTERLESISGASPCGSGPGPSWSRPSTRRWPRPTRSLGWPPSRPPLATARPASTSSLPWPSSWAGRWAALRGELEMELLQAA